MKKICATDLRGMGIPNTKLRCTRPDRKDSNYYQHLKHTSHVRANPARLGMRSSSDATRIKGCRLALILSIARLLDCSIWSRSWSSFSISASFRACTKFIRRDQTSFEITQMTTATFFKGKIGQKPSAQVLGCHQGERWNSKKKQRKGDNNRI